MDVSRPGEQVVLPGAPSDYSVQEGSEWALVQGGRFWKMSDKPAEGPLFSESGEMLAPALSDASGLVDATLLRGDASSVDVRSWAEGIVQLRPRTVCVFPAFLPEVRDLFSDPAVVVSFPHGADSARSKMLQSEEALRSGARELDIVAPLRFIREGDWKSFSKEMRELSRLDAPIKLILETSLWTPEQIKRAAREALEEGIWCLKTSTGTDGGATEEAVRILRDAGATQIKASGGIRSRLRAGEMLRAGATMLGSSNLEEWC